MKKSILTLPLVAVAFVVLWLSMPQAATVTVIVPNGSVSELVGLCDALRVERNARALTNEDCAYYFLSLGLQQYKMRWTSNLLREQQKAAVAQAQVDFDALMPQLTFDVMSCGDGVLDNDVTIPYVEACDDGNKLDGDGCSSTCVVE